MSDSTVLPVHVGFILDGNRRWARQHKQPSLRGHQEGLEVFKDVSLAAFDRGIKYVSAYIFSAENWQRTQDEVSYLMRLVVRGVEKHLKTFHDAGIRLVLLGSRQKLSKPVLRSIDQAEELTKANTRGTLAICLNYGGYDEVAAAAQAVVDAGLTISPQTMRQHLYHPEIPDVDLVIRSSGEQRLSGFMLWRAAYSELVFANTLWPDFTVADLDAALTEYAQRRRRFGN